MGRQVVSHTKPESDTNSSVLTLQHWTKLNSEMQGLLVQLKEAEAYAVKELCSSVRALRIYRYAPGRSLTLLVTDSHRVAKSTAECGHHC